jgi:AhpD family alkylhydroperoxidase
MSTHTGQQPRIDFMQRSPQLFKKFLDFGLATTRDGALDATLAHLVDIRASQLNGCAFCLDMHVKEAKLHGERELRLHHVAIWRESALFSTRERAALAWTETLTRLAPAGVSDEAYAEAREQFSEKELCDLTFRVMAINGWNRINVAFRSVPGAHDRAFGLDKAALA